MIDRAAKRTEWAARALDTAADELLAAGEDGVPVGSLAEVLRTEADCASVLVRRIAELRALAGRRISPVSTERLTREVVFREALGAEAQIASADMTDTGASA
jgi:hypothetical protein